MEAYKEIANWVIGVLTIGGVAVVKHTVGTRKSLADHKTFAAETFVTKPAHETSENRVIVRLTRIEDLLIDHIAKTTPP